MSRHMLAAAMLAVAMNGPGKVAAAQPGAAPAGHWEGAIQMTGQELKIEVDLAQAAGKWEGTIAIPAQGLKGFPLSAIAVEGTSVGFSMRNVPGEPQFAGTVSADGKTISGQLRQGGGTTQFSLTRTGDAKIERPPASTPVTKELEGSWEGALDVDGKLLRLVLKLANQPGGAATGTLVSVDQGGAEVPIASVVQGGTHLKLYLPTIVGSYEADLKDGQLTGTWTQGPRTWQLVFKRQK
jgi:hypothetical protein